MTLALKANFNATTPAAASGKQNVVFADDSGSPIVNVSATDPEMVGDTGSGGTGGNVPAPASGDAAAGKFLKADATWEVPAGSGFSNPMTTEGDIIYGGASGVATRLAAGTSGDVLQTNGSGSAPSWVSPSGGSSAFSALTSGTNTAMAALVGSGATLEPTGSGVIEANELSGVTVSGTPSSGQVLTATSSSAADWQTPGGGGGGAVTQIAQVVVGSGGQASIDFTSIPNTYTNLKLVLSGQSALGFPVTDPLNVNFNADTTSNQYSWGLVSNGSYTSGNNVDFATAGLLPTNNIGSGTLAGTVSIEIAGYANVTGVDSKGFASIFGSVGSSGGVMGNAGGSWSSGAAISSIQLTLGSASNFRQGCIATLYGEQ